VRTASDRALSPKICPFRSLLVLRMAHVFNGRLAWLDSEVLAEEKTKVRDTFARLMQTDFGMKGFSPFFNVSFILVSHTHNAMITNGTRGFKLVSVLRGQRLRSLGVATSFPFPHLSPINAHPQLLSKATAAERIAAWCVQALR
jgi:hypothetical protein